MMYRPPGTAIELPAVPVGRVNSTALNAWGPHGFITVRLVAPLPAVRVHTRAGVAASVRTHLSHGSSAVGRWFAIGDVILTRDQYKAAHALPAGFTHQDDWLFPIGTHLNVGVAGPLFGHPGGALQAEWLSGPEPSRTLVRGYWSGRVGTA